MNDILSAAFLAATLLLPACRSVASRPSFRAAEPAPYYRFFRGVMRADLSQEEYLARMSSTFIPALPAAYADKGASAYIPAVPPASKTAGIADEFALIAWDSEQVYKAARETPQGRGHAELHWTVFDRERSRSGTTVPLAAELAAETPYDVLGTPVDWQKGYATFYIGLRKPGLSSAEFLKGLHAHVLEIREALVPQGLDGYVFVAGADYEAAYLHWPSREAAEAAFASDAGKAAAAGGSAILDHLLFAPAEPFTGKIASGQAVNVLFERKGRHE
ncbi:MAG: hypothetical protein Q7J64_05480 [Elusimicrobiota bacterium]|nr:hypothetical protein [Elusimicrobiota bacterium]